jgi:prephenate dehydrogenase
VTTHPGAPADPGALFPAGVVIIGTGLIGTSVGLALRERGVRVWLADGDPRAAGLAASLGAGDLLPAGPPAAALGSAGPPASAPGSAGIPDPAPGSGGVPDPAPVPGEVPDSAVVPGVPAPAAGSGGVPDSGFVPGVPGSVAGSGGVPVFAPPPGGPADLAVLAVPPDAVAPLLAAAQAAGLAACYTDVASVKARPLAAARALGCDLARYVPGHPLAGRERSGPAAARADLFLGRPWALCPAETTPRAVACVTSLVTACGAEPVTAAADEHDRWVALVSHAPHVVASAMAARLASAPDGALALAGQGLRDVTRIAAGDTALWTQILLANAAGVSDVLALVADDLRQAAAALADAEAAAGAPGDQAAPGAAPPAGEAQPGQPGRADEKAGPRLAALLDAGGAGVARIPGKHAGPATRYAIVQVVIPDQPGELARLFQAAGEAGVNIEDFGIEHSPGLPSGVAELAVSPNAAAPLAAALSARGWPAYAAPPPSGS